VRAAASGAGVLSGDSVTVYKQYRSCQKKAGLAKVNAEVQKQVDAYWAAQKKQERKSLMGADPGVVSRTVFFFPWAGNPSLKPDIRLSGAWHRLPPGKQEACNGKESFRVLRGGLPRMPGIPRVGRRLRGLHRQGRRARGVVRPVPDSILRPGEGRAGMLHHL
jgi:hypothetical protein